MFLMYPITSRAGGYFSYYFITYTFLLLICTSSSSLSSSSILHFYLVSTFHFKIVEFSDEVKPFKGRSLHNLHSAVTSTKRCHKSVEFLWWKMFLLIHVSFDFSQRCLYGINNDDFNQKSFSAEVTIHSFQNYLLRPFWIDSKRSHLTFN